MKLGIRREAALMLFCEESQDADAVHVEALGDGEALELGPSFEHDRRTASPGLSNAVLALVLARASHGVSP